jgi:ATP-dependent DNA ligase
VWNRKRKRKTLKMKRILIQECVVQNAEAQNSNKTIELGTIHVQVPDQDDDVDDVQIAED